MRHILIPVSCFILLVWNITTQSTCFSLGRRRRQTRVPTMFFYVPESNYPSFCGTSSEVTDHTVTKYCHPGKPFSIQQGGFFLLGSHWKGSLFSGWTPGECYQQWPLGAGTQSSCDKTRWLWRRELQQHLAAAGTQKMSCLSHCMGNFGWFLSSEATRVCIFFLFPS